MSNWVSQKVTTVTSADTGIAARAQHAVARVIPKGGTDTSAFPFHLQQLLERLHETQDNLEIVENQLSTLLEANQLLLKLETHTMNALGNLGRHMKDSYNSRTVGVYLTSEQNVLDQRVELGKAQETLLWEPLTLLVHDVKTTVALERKYAKLHTDYHAFADKVKSLQQQHAQSDANSRASNSSSELSLAKREFKSVGLQFSALESALEAACGDVEEKRRSLVDEQLRCWMASQREFHRESLGSLGIASLYLDGGGSISPLLQQPPPRSSGRRSPPVARTAQEERQGSYETIRSYWFHHVEPPVPFPLDETSGQSSE